MEKRTEYIDLSMYEMCKHERYPVIPSQDKWKALILLMRTGEWMTIDYMQMKIPLGRKSFKTLLKKGMAAGIIEKSYEEGWQQPGAHNWHSKGRGWLYRRYAYYRLNLDKIQVIIK